MPITLEQLLELEEIKRLKYAYLRSLDCKQWDDLANLLTEDVTTSYSDGKYTFTGKAAAMDFLKESMSDLRVVTKHQCHHPEIDFVSATEASGIWYLTDLVINPGDHQASPPIPAITLEGTGFYEDRYRKVNGVWKISHTGYQRVYREIYDRKNMPVLHLKTRFKV